ncbi:MAG: hypothetical protein KA419_20725 [Acidobacteria bacterium]|nr:hypothetical protein [Acidobacteriota bacterium]
MNFCIHCGAPLKEGAGSCDICGAMLSDSPTVMTDSVPTQSDWAPASGSDKTVECGVPDPGRPPAPPEAYPDAGAPTQYVPPSYPPPDAGAPTEYAPPSYPPPGYGGPGPMDQGPEGMAGAEGPMEAQPYYDTQAPPPAARPKGSKKGLLVLFILLPIVVAGGVVAVYFVMKDRQAASTPPAASVTSTTTPVAGPSDPGQFPAVSSETAPYTEAGWETGTASPVDATTPGGPAATSPGTVPGTTAGAVRRPARPGQPEDIGLIPATTAGSQPGSRPGIVAHDDGKGVTAHIEDVPPPPRPVQPPVAAAPKVLSETELMGKLLQKFTPPPRKPGKKMVEIRVNVMVDPYGNVISAVANPADKAAKPNRARDAEATVMKWKFMPTQEGGARIAVRGVVTIRFE